MTADAQIQATGTVALDLTMSGTFDAGDPNYPWIVDLTGSQINVQVDLKKGLGSINVSIPDMDNFTEEILLLDDVEFARSSLGGNIWTRQQANGSIGSLVALVRDATGTALMDAMTKGELTAASAPDATFHGDTAHQVTLTVTVPETFDIEAFISSTLGSKVGTPPEQRDPTVPTKTIPVELFLASDDMHPLGIQLTMPSGEADPEVVGDTSVSIDGVFSRPAGTLSVTAPKKFVDATNPYNPPR
jgi:hypothetical protein